MSAEGQAVVGLPLTVVENTLTDPAAWPAFLGGLVAVDPISFERYGFTVRQAGGEHDLFVAVRRWAGEHRVTWRSLEGVAWDGELAFEVVNGRRTKITLRRTVLPRSLLAGLAELLRAGRVDVQHDLVRLQELLAAIPAPARPTRARPVTAAERERRTAQIAQASGRLPGHVPQPRLAVAENVQDVVTERV